jgi:hypothetical protein
MSFLINFIFWWQLKTNRYNSDIQCGLARVKNINYFTSPFLLGVESK